MESDLYALVAARIEKSPIAIGGEIWCVYDRQMLADQCGISLKTLQRRLSQSPFRRRWFRRDNNFDCLIGLGEPLPPSVSEMRNKLVRLWEKKFDRKATADEKQHLYYFAKDVGTACMEVLGYVIQPQGWQHFMSVAKLQIQSLPPKERQVRFYAYPTASVIRRFWVSANDVYLTRLQESGMWEKANKLKWQDTDPYDSHVPF